MSATRGGSIAVVASVLTVLALGPAAGGGDGRIEDALRRGGAASANLDWAGALAAYGEAVRAYRERDPGSDEPALRKKVTGALAGMAGAHLALGNEEQVAAALREAIGVDPAFEPPREVQSARLLEIFRTVRAAMVGFLSFRIIPEDATIRIDSRTIGPAPAEAVPWLAGRITIRLEAPGHEPDWFERELRPGETALVQHALTPNARTLIFLTSPPGVRILLDGQVRAVSAGPAPVELAGRYGLDPGRLSGETRVEAVPPGRHTLRFEHPCHDPETRTVSVVADSEPLRFDPIALSRSTGRLTIRSDPPNALIRIDSRQGAAFENLVEAGRTPATLDAVCSGTRRVELLGERGGMWTGEVVVSRNQEAVIEQRLRPALVFLGVHAVGGEHAGEAAAAEREVRERLGGVASYQSMVVDAAAGGGSRAEMVAPLLLPAGPSVDAVRAIADPLHADLLLVGRMREERELPVLDLLLYSRHQATPDVSSAPVEGPAAGSDLLGRLDAPVALRRPWLGGLAIDTPGRANPVIARVAPGGPAASAGIEPGDRIVTFDGADVADAAALDRAVAASGARGAGGVRLQLLRGDSEMQVVLRVGGTPVVVAPGRPDVLYNKVLVDLAYVGSGDPLASLAARLGRAMAFVHFGRCAEALEGALDGAQAPDGAGISAGTVDYLRGVCYDRLGATDRARRAFEAAARTEATLESHDGPAVAPLAALFLEPER